MLVDHELSINRLVPWASSAKAFLRWVSIQRLTIYSRGQGNTGHSLMYIHCSYSPGSPPYAAARKSKAVKV